MAAPVSRKELLQLGLLFAIAWVVILLLRYNVPLGREIGANPLARAVLRDTVSPTVGPADADLTLVLFTDYNCAACKLAAPAMDAAVARDGRVRVIYKEWPVFGPRSHRAARVALAASYQNIYPGVHRRLMTGRQLLDDVVLRQAVEAAGGNWPRLTADLVRSKTDIDRQLSHNRRQAFGLGIPGTPTYLVGPILASGAFTEAEFARLFAQARKVSSDQR